jgi:hypothetical protein
MYADGCVNPKESFIMYHDEITVAPMSILPDIESIRPVFNSFIRKNLTKDEVKSKGVFVLQSTMNGETLHFALMVCPRLKSYYAFITPEEKSMETLIERCRPGFKKNAVWKEFLEALRDLHGKDFGYFISKHLSDRWEKPAAA